MTPTGNATIYTATSNDAGGTISTTSNVGEVLLTTDSSAAGDDESLRVSGLLLERDPASAQPGFTSMGITKTGLRYITTFLTSSALTVEGFVGLLGSQQNALTTIPTTTRHCGIYWDLSAEANYILTSGNNSAQAETDTGIAVDAALHTFDVAIQTNNLATAVMRDSTGAVEATHPISLMGSGIWQPHWFVQTETTAARTLRVLNWLARRE